MGEAERTDEYRKRMDMNGGKDDVRRGKILFFGGYERDYPRISVIRKGLEKIGFPFGECWTDTRFKVHLRYPLLTYRFLKRCMDSKVVFVPSFRHKDVPLAWFLAKISGKKLVFDPLVSRFETRVLDRRDVKMGSSQAWHNRNIDKLSFNLPDLVIADTAAHARYYEVDFGVREENIEVLPVGFDEDIFKESEKRVSSDLCEVLFFGSFLPLHGVEVIIKAASILVDKPVRFTIIGKGQTFDEAVKLAGDLPVGKVRFLKPVPMEELPSYIESSDIVLGIFGTTRKAGMVVPNKIFQSLAVGRAVITADTDAVNEFFTPGEHLMTVPAGSPEGLADAIDGLRRNVEFRMKLSRKGCELVREKYSSTRIAERFVEVLEKRGFLESSPH